MNRRSKWVLGILLGCIAFGMTAQQSMLKQVLPEGMFRKMGLHKLAPSELAELEKFIADLVTVARTTPSPPSVSLPSYTYTPYSLSFSSLDGRAIIVGQDPERTYLGKISSNRFDTDSIINEFGRGSKYRSDSILNDFGQFGSRFSSYSPFNPYASDPPKVFIGTQFVGYLTKNIAKYPRIDPDALIGYLRSQSR